MSLLLINPFSKTDLVGNIIRLLLILFLSTNSVYQKEALSTLFHDSHKKVLKNFLPHQQTSLSYMKWRYINIFIYIYISYPSIVGPSLSSCRISPWSQITAKPLQYEFSLQLLKTQLSWAHIKLLLRYNISERIKYSIKNTFTCLIKINKNHTTI